MAARNATLRCVRHASKGHRGLVKVLADARTAFLDEVTQPHRQNLGKQVRGRDEAEREWSSLLISAAEMVMGSLEDGYGITECVCHLDVALKMRAAQEEVQAARERDIRQVMPAAEGHLVTATGEPVTLDQETSRRVAHPANWPWQLVRGGGFIFDRPELDCLWGEGDRVLWSAGEALMIGGPSGVAGEVIRSPKSSSLYT